MDIASAGRLLSGAGSFVSGVKSLFGGGGDSPEHALKKQIMVQSDMLPYRIKAFEKAGIHPLTGLGLPTMSTSVQSIGGNNDAGDSLYQMGQGIQGAANAFVSKEEKAIVRQSAALDLEHKQLQNDYLRAQIAQASPVGRPGGFALTSTLPETGVSGFDADVSQDVSLTSGQSGNYSVVPSTGVKQKIEDMIVPELQWYMRQLLAPKVPGYTYNPLTGDLVPDGQSRHHNAMRKIDGWLRQIGRTNRFYKP